MARRRGHNEGCIQEIKDDTGKVIFYRPRITIPGVGQRSLERFKTRKEAQRRLDEVKSQMHQGRLLPSKSQTVEKYLEGWLETKHTSLKPTAYAAHKLNVERIKPHLGHIKLDALAPAHVQDCYNQLAKRLAPNSVRQAHITLHKALEDAMALDLVARNVAHKRTLPRVDDTERPWYTVEQLDALFTATEGDHFHALWVVLGTVGLRHGEALALRWRDIDFKRRTLTVRYALQRQARQGDEEHGKLVFVEPKSARSRRTVELSDTALRALQNHQERQAFARKAAGSLWQENDLVFPSEIGTPLEKGRVHKHWTKATEKASIPRYRIHDLRHTVATHLMMAGMGAREVAEVLGHSNASLVLKVYGHVAPSTQRKAADLMEVLLKGVATEASADVLGQF